MPIIYHKELNSGWIALWRISESVEQLIELVSDADAVTVREFKSESRQREWLSWRALVAELLDGVRVGYDELGAPILIDGKGFIGVSHEREFVAVIFSHIDICAIDIERLDRKFHKVVDRYISHRELQELDSGSPLFNAAVWCGKEVLYKNAGRIGLDLLKDICITATDFDKGEMRGCVNGTDEVQLSLFTYENRLIVYTLLR